jgi:hypothetical protein
MTVFLARRSYERTEWRLYFAWRPVHICEADRTYWVWFEWVERNGPWEFGNCWSWTYRRSV